MPLRAVGADGATEGTAVGEKLGAAVGDTDVGAVVGASVGVAEGPPLDGDAVVGMDDVGEVVLMIGEAVGFVENGGAVVGTLVGGAGGTIGHAQIQLLVTLHDTVEDCA